VSSVITLFFTGLCLWILIYIQHRLGAGITTDGMNIIGEADGPVSILVDHSFSLYYLIFVPFAIALAGAVYLMATKKSRKD
jgi:hypothetical protein